MSEAIFDQLRDIVCDRLDVEPELFQDDASFIEHLGADSLDLVDLIMNVEEAFQLQIPDDDYIHFATVKQAVEYIAAHRGSAPQPATSDSEAATV
jgi:acyl carrier protein